MATYIVMGRCRDWASKKLKLVRLKHLSIDQMLWGIPIQRDWVKLGAAKE
jgi:hypothetical protein